MDCTNEKDNTLVTIETAEQWVELSNHKSLDGLLKLTASEVEINGPKGSGFMSNTELKDWLDRANLQLATINHFAKDEFIVLEQHGTWLNEDESIKGQSIVFTVMRIINGKVKYLARFDNKEQAFQTSGLSEKDRII